MNPKDFNLPFPSFRPVQEDALKWALPEALGKKVLLLEAPPGVGKSGIGKAWAEGLGDPYAVLAQTISYLDQYQDTLSLPPLKGRGNFRCNQLSTSCEAKCMGTPTSSCPADAHAMSTRRLPAITTTYAMYLQSSMWRPTLVCDEGHRLLDVLGEFGSILVSYEDLEIAQLPPPPTLEPTALKSWARGMMSTYLTADRRPDPKRSLQRSMAWDRCKTTMERALKMEENGEYVHVDRERGVRIIPVWPTADRVTGAKHLLIQSATLYGGHLLAKMLGMTPGSYSYRFLPSPFDVSSRPALYLPTVAVNNRMGPDGWRMMARGIDAVLSNHPGKKALVTVNSYAQVGQVAKYMAAPERKVLTHHEGIVRQGRSDLFRQFREAGPDTVMVSASAWEGEDFPHDQLRVHIIAKVLYPNLGDPVVAARYASGKLGKEWYAATACGNMAQAYGRIMRADNDWGYTYILDSSFGNMLKYNREYIPRFFKEAITRVGD